MNRRHQAGSGGAGRRFRRPPRGTVRLRLTLLYTGLFLACGTVLLAMTYFLVTRATADIFTVQGSDGGRVTGTVQRPPDVNGHSIQQQPSQTKAPRSGPGPSAAEQAAQVALASRQRHEQHRQLLIQSGIALLVVTVLSAGLGWLVAGRILRPLRTITRTAQDISASNLHERLTLDGPNDELKHLGDTFDRLLARLESSFTAQRQFIANASHELRTPLARQRTIAQVALADPQASVESLREAHERVLAAGAQQEQLIAVLLTLARGQAGVNQHLPFDLAGLGAEALAARSAEADYRGLTLAPVLEPALSSGDRQLAERLVTNLVDNALKYNVPGGRIDVVTRTEDGHAVLRVSNTGPVVPPDAVDRLFQPFHRLGDGRSARQTQGLGLGLSIVEAVATAHGAQVEATARPEGGLDVTVRFPHREAGGRGRPSSRSGSGPGSADEPDAGRTQLTSAGPRPG
jgi:signal transduction histidine kinase